MLAVPRSLPASAHREAAYVAAALWAIAREEHAGRKPKRLLEAGHATWERFKGRMGPRDLVGLLLEDAAVTLPEPFAFSAILGPDAALDVVPEALLGDWLGLAPSLPLDMPVREYVDAQAQLLGIEGRPAYAELPKLQPHHRVLELPGSAGRLATHIASTQAGVAFHDVFTFAASSWQERVLVGLGAAALGTVGAIRVSLDPELRSARASGERFTHVLGVRPDKGGTFSKEALEPWFTGADIKLV